MKSFLQFLFTMLLSTALVLCGGNRHALSDPHTAIARQNGGHVAQTAAPRSAPHDDLLAEHQRGDERQAIRIRPDAQRARLWVLTLEHVYVYDTSLRKLIRRISLPNWPVVDSACPPDMALDQRGAAVVSNNVQPKVLQIDPASFQMTEHSLRLISDKQWEIGFGGLAFGADGTLFGLSAVAGSLFVIDLASRTAREIALSERITGSCVLAKAGQNHARARARTISLCVDFATVSRRIDVSADLAHARLTSERCES